MSFITVEPPNNTEIKPSLYFSSNGSSRYIPSSSLFLVAGAMIFIEALVISSSGVIAEHAYLQFLPWGSGGFPKGGRGAVGIGNLSIVLALTWMFLAGWMGLYRPAHLIQPSVKVGQLMLALGVSFLIMLALLFLLKTSEDYSRGMIVVWLLLSAFALIVERVAMNQWIVRRQTEGAFKRRVAIYGSGTNLHNLREALGAQCFDASIVGHFGAADPNTEKENLGDIEQLISFGQNNGCDQIVISLPFSEKDKMEETVEKLSVLPVDLTVLPDVGPLVTRVNNCRMIGKMPSLVVHQRPLTDLQCLAKSTIDFILSAAGLILLMPIFVLISVAILLEGPGPVLFVQRRHGYNHKVIRVLKFRTMNVTEDDGEIRQAKVDDERFTRVGSLLRKTSLDELPQLWNVLRGEMSLVGPRPHALSHNIYYANLFQKYSGRHRVKPGITGWAQIYGLRGATASPEKMQKRAELDLYYIDNWSLGLDLKILLLTLPSLLTGKNAF